MIKKIAFVILVLLVLIAVLGVIAPKDFDVSRSVVIQKPRPEVYNYLRFLQNQDEWSSWSKKDPNRKQKLTGTDGEVGAILWWEGNAEVGTGEQEITKLMKNNHIDFELRFLEPFKMTADMHMTLVDHGAGTQVSWGFTGKNKFPFNILMLFMSMDKSVGKDFEVGLSNLKTTLESK